MSSVRYARALNINTRDVNDALQSAREAMRKGRPMPGSGRTITPNPDTESAPLPDAP